MVYTPGSFQILVKLRLRTLLCVPVCEIQLILSNKNGDERLHKPATPNSLASANVYWPHISRSHIRLCLETRSLTHETGQMSLNGAEIKQRCEQMYICF